MTGAIIAGCANSKTTRPDAHKPIRYALESEPETLDPRKMTGSPEMHVVVQIFEGLTTLDANSTPLPAAAERWDVSSDGLTYKFYIRANAKWSNGDPVTAHDFEYAWKTALSPELGSKYADQLYYLKNGEEYNTRKTAADQVGVKALDDKTLEVTLKEPCAYFPSLTAFYTYFPVHKKTVEANPAWASDGKSIIGNGPFKITDWVHNGNMNFVKNEYYWDSAKVKTTALELPIADSNTTRLAMFENNQVDIAMDPPNAELERLKKENKVTIFPLLATYFYNFNVTKAPFDNVKVRKAFALAIDREAIVQTVTRGGQVPALAWVPPGVPDAKAGDDFRKAGSDFYRNNDIETAKKLLAEAGYPDGKGFPVITITYNTLENHKAIAEALQEMWKKNLGVEVKITNQEWKVFLNTRRQLDFQISRDGWVGDYPDALTFIGLFTSYSGNNSTGWKNSRYDALVAQAKGSLDPAVRMKAMHEAEKILMEDMPIVPIYYYTQPWCIKPNLKGYVRTITDVIYFKEAYVE